MNISYAQNRTMYITLGNTTSNMSCFSTILPTFTFCCLSDIKFMFHFNMPCIFNLVLTCGVKNINCTLSKWKPSVYKNLVVCFLFYLPHCNFLMNFLRQVRLRIVYLFSLFDISHLIS